MMKKIVVILKKIIILLKRNKRKFKIKIVAVIIIVIVRKLIKIVIVRIAVNCKYNNNSNHKPQYFNISNHCSSNSKINRFNYNKKQKVQAVKYLKIKYNKQVEILLLPKKGKLVRKRSNLVLDVVQKNF